MEKERYSEERADLIVGIITIAIFLSLFLWMLISIGNNARNATGTLASERELRRGSEQTISYTLDKADVKDGAKVEWSINGEKVGETTYTKGEPLTFNYTPETSGTIVVRARVGKYSQSAMMEVKPPRLTVSAPNVTMTYGDEMPQINCVVEGFINGEEGEIDLSDLCRIDADKLNVGVYTVDFCKDCNYLDYEMKYVTGTLTVLPRTLNVVEHFEKVYDGTNTICNPDIELVGTRYGDDVCAECDTLYFDSKNVGERQIMLGNVRLVGEDASNYTLCGYAQGAILPKNIDIVGLTVKDKIYDGTTKATIDTMGSILGVCEGDSVAIGNISVNFDDAGVGERNFVVGKVSLVGADKDNYRINNVQTGSAKINSTLMQRLSQRDPVAQGAN